jgi:chromate transporter
MGPEPGVAGATPQAAPPPSFAEAFAVWLKIGLLSFGGPAAQIALMHRIVVDEKRWIDEPRFLHALNYCMLLPGPEAQQLATYLGWLLHRTAGGLVAGILFVLPGAAVMLALSIIYALYARVPVIEGLFWGIRAAVLAIVVEAILRIGRRALKNRAMYAVAAAAFFGIFFLQVPFPLIVLMAGALGFFGARLWPGAFAAAGGHAAAPQQATPGGAAAGRAAAAGAVRSQVVIVTLGALLWFGPTLAFAAWLGWSSGFAHIGLFFSKMAVVTFGGAYAVLAYVAQQAVETYGWLAAGEMLTGLGLAETTPGPLIMVVQFVGFLGAFRHPGPVEPLTAGIIGGLLATWVTFVPCFIWIFLGAPYVERLRGNVRLSAALATVTAAVVGVILNLALWFALHVLFAEIDEVHFGPMRLLLPDVTSLNPWAFLIAAAAMLAMLRFHVGIVLTLAGAALAGILLHL